MIAEKLVCIKDVYQIFRSISKSITHTKKSIFKLTLEISLLNVINFDYYVNRANVPLSILNTAFCLHCKFELTPVQTFIEHNLKASSE